MEGSFVAINEELARVKIELQSTRNEMRLLKDNLANRNVVGLIKSRIGLILIAALGIASIVVGQGAAKVTRFQAPFEIVDEKGLPIVRVVKEERFRGLQAVSPQSKSVCLIGLSRGSESGTVSVVAENGQGFAELGVADDMGLVAIGSSQSASPLGHFGSANLVHNSLKVGEGTGERKGVALRLQEEDGTAVAELSNNTDGSGMSLKIRSKKGAVVAGLGANPGGDGSAALKISNVKGEILASMETMNNTGHVNVFAPSGSALANMGAEPNGKGFVRVGAVENLEAVSLTVGSGGGGVVQTKDTGGMGVIIGTREGKGDLCANGKKGLMCFSALCAKNIMPYW